MQNPSAINNEKGAALIIVILVLALLTLIGRTMMNSSRVDMEMAGNHTRYKEAFYQADGGTEVAFELLEQNIGCPLGFSDNIGIVGQTGAVIGEDPMPVWNTVPCPDPANELKSVMVSNLNFAGDWNPVKPVDVASSDLHYPANMTDACPDWPRTLVTVGMVDKNMGTGSGLGDNAGYEALGTASAKGGTKKVYQIFSRRIQGNDDLTITATWRHIVGQEGDCNY